MEPAQQPPAPFMIAIDTETTGVGKDKEPVEIGAATVEADSVTFHSMVKPSRGFHKSARSGIEPGTVATAPDCVTAIENLREWAAGVTPLGRSAVFVAHNASFDCGAIGSGIARCGEGTTPTSLWWYTSSIRCSLQRAKVLKRFGGSSLDDIYLQLFKEPIAGRLAEGGRHSAEVDASALAKVILAWPEIAEGPDMSTARLAVSTTRRKTKELPPATTVDEMLSRVIACHDQCVKADGDLEAAIDRLHVEQEAMASLVPVETDRAAEIRDQMRVLRRELAAETSETSPLQDAAMLRVVEAQNRVLLAGATQTSANSLKRRAVSALGSLDFGPKEESGYVVSRQVNPRGTVTLEKLGEYLEEDVYAGLVLRFDKRVVTVTKTI